MAKEAYLDGKRGLFLWQKRPISMAKEAYLEGAGKRESAQVREYIQWCDDESIAECVLLL